ncbi:MAG: L-2-hydroxyglutarate oxidase [Thermodesulfobacteriota bacterium]
MRYARVIIGGGIVGLATAHALLRHEPSARVLVLEKEDAIGRHQTGHNSGVIHSGIYYRPGSDKAATCRQGYEMLLRFCARHDIPCEICGKLIVATHARELPWLEEVYRRGVANGLASIERLNAARIREFEPHVAGIAGLRVAQTGIIDFRAVAAKLAEEIRVLGGEIRCREKVVDLRQRTDEVEVVTERGTVAAAGVINCGGLHSDRLAMLDQGAPSWRIIPFRGEYFLLRPERRHLVRGLVYPVPDPAFPFLGVHFTRLLDGGVEAGPNAVLAFKREGYRRTDFDAGDLFATLRWPGFRILARRYWRAGWEEMQRSWSKKKFVAALQRLVPEIGEDDLLPAGAGVRAQACTRDGRLVDDFLLLADRRVLHVGNAPSPAATASLAIGEWICRRLVA